ncbi:MAG: MBL fold metallo-hydrolase, partial [Candidatus Omnitrophica bacterium]|nr:MBL fold metallo-hydrolase [Candidatus Omnitrophota bacterium]
MTEHIRWLGHASFMINSGDALIYIDPYNLIDFPPADIILITHQHYDHCSPGDIKKIKGNDTVIVAPADCAVALGNITEISPGKEVDIKGIKIKAVAAYNTNKQFHQQPRQWVGYIIDTPEGRIYHSGDTDLIPEMDDIKPDIALLCIGGTYTMDVREAHQAALRIRPKLAIPMHYGEVVGSGSDADEFKSLCERDGIRVNILK